MPNYRDGPTSYSNTIGASIIAMMAVGMVAVMWKPAMDPDAWIPAKAALVQARGQAHAVCVQKNAVQFRLRGHAGKFYYSSVSGNVGSVANGLAAAGEREVTVLFNPRGSAVRQVWELNVDGNPIRSFAQSQEGHRSNNRLARWMCIGSLVAAVWYSWLAWRDRPLRLRATGAGAKR